MMTERGICTYSYAYLTYWNVIQYKYVIYNSLFININSRSLSSEEVNCTTACVDKTMNFNNRVSALYVSCESICEIICMSGSLRSKFMLQKE